MNGISRRDNEDAPISEDAKLLAEQEVLFHGIGSVHADRKNRDIRIGKEVSEDRPSAVIDPALDGLPEYTRSRLLEEFCSLGKSWARILERIQGLGESSKIMDRLWMCTHRNVFSPRVPVRRDETDRPRSRELFSELGECVYVWISIRSLECHHGRSMGKKKHGHAGHRKRFFTVNKLYYSNIVYNYK